MTIHPDVVAGWRAFSEPLEGRYSYLYRDVRGLVTTGVGNLCDPVGLAISLPWQHPDGTPATADEIAADWHRVKALPAGMVAWRYAGSRPLVLSDEAIDSLVTSTLNANARILAAFFPDFATFPPPAQQALLSLAWACGAGSERPGVTSPEWPRLQAAVRRRAWLEAADQCAIRSTRNAGVVPRNKANRALLLQAAVLEAP